MPLNLGPARTWDDSWSFIKTRVVETVLAGTRLFINNRVVNFLGVAGFFGQYRRCGIEMGLPLGDSSWPIGLASRLLTWWRPR